VVGLVRSATLSISNPSGAPIAGLQLRILDDRSGVFAPRRALPSTLGAGQHVLVPISFSPHTVAVFEAGAVVSADRVRSATVALLGTSVLAPDCTDNNPCTTDTPLLDGSCAHEPVEGACDDGNACTVNTVCVQGRCLGEARSCIPPASCFVGVCDAQAGCAFIQDPTACDDHDPCTIDTCTNDGCAHDHAPDGTPCGSFVQCKTVHVCVLGSCIEAPVPDHTPCSDGDACTEGDRCSSGVCSGDPVVHSAELISFAPTFGGPSAIGTVIGDGRVLILDPLPDGRGALATVLVRGSTGATVLAEELRTDLLHLDRGGLVRTGTGAQVALLDDAGDVQVLEVSSASRLVSLGLAPLLPPPQLGRSSLVTLGGTWYACALGADDVVIIDARVPSSLSALGHISTVRACSGLAVDAARSQLLVSSYGSNGRPGGLTRFSLADPRSPQEIDRSFLGTGVLVATNGETVAVADADAFVSTPFVRLLDPTDLSERSRIDTSGGFSMESFGDLQLAGDVLFVQNKSGLSAWNVRDPSLPQPLFVVPHSSVGNGSNSPPRSAVATDGRVLFRASEIEFGSVPLLLDVSGATPIAVDHPSRGGVARLESSSGVMFAFDQTSIHALDDGQPDQPRWESGSTVPAQTADATLWSLGPGGGPPRLFAADTWPGIYTSADEAMWRDGSNPSATLMLTAAFEPFVDGSLYQVADDGHQAVALAVSYADESARLLTYDLDALSPARAPRGLSPTASLALSTGPFDAREGLGTIALGDGRAVAIALGPLGNLFDPAMVVSSHVFVVDLMASAIVAQATLSSYVVSADLSGDRVVLVVKASAGLCCGPFLGEVVRTFSARGGAWALEGEATLAESWRILEVTPTSAIVSTRRGAAFLALDPSGPRVKGELPLPEPPVAARHVGERIWLGGPHGVVSVRPPCP
jgi:hypothetical protein